MELTKFADIEMSDELKAAVADVGYDEATLIQSKAIPLIKTGRDIIGLSETGSGKTAAFGLPAIDLVDIDEDPRTVQVLIICPTRELALQNCNELRKFAKYKQKINIVPIFGGDAFDRQLNRLRTGCQIVVGTPGRIMDHMRRKTLKLNNVKMVVLDEADEMLDMGFVEDIETILGAAPEERQTTLFSATMPKAVLEITKRFQREPVTINVESKQKTVASIEQFYVRSPLGRKADVLYCLLEYHKPRVAMVFCNTKKMVDELVELLSARGISAMALHGDMRQSARTHVMNEFRSGKFSVLVATDVAARGIDINDVEIVFNFDLPMENEYYVHRIGRTGRAGKSGMSFSLVCGSKQLSQLMNTARFANCTISEASIPTQEEIDAKNTDIVIDKILDALKDNSGETPEAVYKLISRGYTPENLNAAMFSMLLSQYRKAIIEKIDVPKAEKIVLGSEPERVRSRRRNGSQSDSEKRERLVFDKSKYDNSNMVTVKLTIGKKDKISKNHILGAAAGETGLAGKVFGAIVLDERFSTIDVPKEFRTKAIKALDGCKINGRTVKAFVVNGASRERTPRK